LQTKRALATPPKHRTQYRKTYAFLANPITNRCDSLSLGLFFCAFGKQSFAAKSGLCRFIGHAESPFSFGAFSPNCAHLPENGSIGPAGRHPGLCLNP
jgi:hypothetical protein